MVIFTIVATTIDNVLRPLLIKKGVDLPLGIIFAGVIGGVISFGAIGLFIGPIGLAVAYTLTRAWVSGNGTQTGKPSDTNPVPLAGTGARPVPASGT